MMTDILGLSGFLDNDDFLKLMSRLLFDLIFTGTIVLGVYYRRYRNWEFVFTYFVFNIITFSLCLLLRKVPMELGFALGLFAVFGILRYRTEPIRMQDLTYMFIVIGLGIINAVSNKKISMLELVAVNSAIIGVSAFIELCPRLHRHKSTPMLYDNLALLEYGREDELYKDISKRTGLEVMGVQLHRIDLLRDTADLTVLYQTKPSSQSTSSIDRKATESTICSTLDSEPSTAPTKNRWQS